MKKFPYRLSVYKNILKFSFFIFFSLFCIPGVYGQQLSGNWRDTLKWLETFYEYPASGPNYDWPSSYKPRIVQGYIYFLDGTKIPAPSSAGEISMEENPGGFGTPHLLSSAAVFRLDYNGKTGAKNIFKELNDYLKKNYSLDIQEGQWKQFDSVFEIIIANSNYRATLTVPGKYISRTTINYADSGTYVLSLAVNRVEHFYFSRNHLRVVKDHVMLSDGTKIPVFPNRNISLVETGNVQGSEPEKVIVSYHIRILGGENVDEIFNSVKRFYASHFRFSPGDFHQWDLATDSFIVHKDGSDFEMKIHVQGQPLEHSSKTSLKVLSENDYSLMLVELYFKNKRQIIPGVDESLPER